MPRCGMFLWVKVHWIRHPALGALVGSLSNEEMDSKFQEVELGTYAKALEDELTAKVAFLVE